MMATTQDIFGNPYLAAQSHSLFREPPSTIRTRESTINSFALDLQTGNRRNSVDSVVRPPPPVAPAPTPPRYVLNCMSAQKYLKFVIFYSKPFKWSTHISEKNLRDALNASIFH